ncbi:BGTF surface domain-containing protein, partial [Halorubrum sp. AD140]|uniref:DUF7827 domain-containing protein n=1 Tax=Halorubrum sp. AD140 TaxID=3050073 RepID=UPI002ACCCC6A
MTNDTNTRTKANAVFFAAVMVLSMVAFGFAAAPAAAAVTDLSNGSAEDVTVGSEAAPQEVTFDVDIEEGDTDEQVITNLSEAADAGVAPSVDDVSSNTSDVTVSDEGIDGADHTVNVSDDNTSNGAHSATITVTYEHDTSDASAIDNVDFAIEDDDASETTTATFDIQDVNPSYDPDSDLYYSGQEIDASGLAQDTDYQLRSVDDRDSDGNISSSSPVEQFSTDDNGNYTLDTDDLDTGDYFLRGPGIDDEEATEFEVSTQDLSTEFADDEVEEGEEVDLEVDSNRGTYSLNVTADGLDEGDLDDIFRNVDDVDTDEEEERVTLNDISDGDIAANFSDIDEDEYDFDFEVTDTNAEDSASINVTEAEDGELDVSSATEEQGGVAAVDVELDNTDEGTLVIGNEEDDGYQANVTVEDDEDDEVTVLFNTYAAGNESDDVDNNDIVYTEDEDATVELEDDTNLSNILDTGTYDLSVGPYTDADDRFEDTVDDPDSISSLSIQERSDDTELALWRTSESVESDLAEELSDENESATVSLIEDSIEDDLVTETDTLAIDDDGDRSDVLVHQLTASGLEGVLEDADNEDLGDGDTTNQFYNVLQNDSDIGDDGDKLDVVLEQQNPDSNEDANEIDVNQVADEVDSETFSEIFTVVYDEESDNYYVVANADNLNEELEDNGDLSDDIDPIEGEDEYEVQVSLQDARLLDLLDEDDEDTREEAFESASASFTAEEAEGEFDNEDEIQVEAAENQSITGTTNVAPGTEVNMRVRSDDDSTTSFIENDEDIVVSADGEFEGTFDDFEEAEVNDTFTAQINQAAFDAESDGTVVEQTEEPASFEVSDLDPEEATVTQGDEVTVSATIENTGEAEGTQDVALT